MIDPKNTVNLVGGITRIEFPTENIMKLGLAIDYAGSEKGSDNTSGYFDVVYYMNNDENARNAKFIRSQIDAGNLKVGSQIQLFGRLVHERWATNESKGQRVVIVAEAITYSGRAAKPEGSTSGGSSGKVSQEALPENW